MKKYTLLHDDYIDGPPRMYRIQALIDIPDIGVRRGDLGGYIKSENNLSQEGSAWVEGKAWVGDSARVVGEAWVGGKAHVGGEAWVGGKAHVGGRAHVEGEARVGGKAHVGGEAWVGGKAHVVGKARVRGKAHVGGEAWVGGKAQVSFTPINIIGERYEITITDAHISIGCCTYTEEQFIRLEGEPRDPDYYASHYQAIRLLAMLHWGRKQERKQ